MSAILVEYRLRHPAIGTFPTVAEAEAYRLAMVQPKGWKAVELVEPVAVPSQVVK